MYNNCWQDVYVVIMIMYIYRGIYRGVQGIYMDDIYANDQVCTSSVWITTVVTAECLRAIVECRFSKKYCKWNHRPCAGESNPQNLSSQVLVLHQNLNAGLLNTWLLSCPCLISSCSWIHPFSLLSVARQKPISLNSVEANHPAIVLQKYWVAVGWRYVLYKFWATSHDVSFHISL